MKHLFASLVVALACSIAGAQDKIKVLIVDGQNNHNWKGTTPVLKQILENCGKFAVDVSTTPPAKSPADAWAKWSPKFSDYAVVLMNYTGDEWPDAVKSSFESYVKNGGGLVIYHAANNAFPKWPEYNLMIGLGGWGGRNEKTAGPMLRLRDGKWVEDMTPGAGGTHGPAHEFIVETRNAEHPIMKGLPAKWLHAKDELYSKLRGPAKNLTVLASAFADPKHKGCNEHEPMLMVLDYGKGRVFHTALGHDPNTIKGVGFQVTLQRGTEWAATGKVTLPVPAAGLLSEEKAVYREASEIKP